MIAVTPNQSSKRTGNFDKIVHTQLRLSHPISHQQSLIIMSASAPIGTSSPNPFDYFAIRNVISDYCLALDTKTFKLLTEGVFTAEVDAVYPFFTVKGAQDVADRIEKRFVAKLSQIPLELSLFRVRS